MNLKTPKAQKQRWGRLCGTRIEGGVLLREESVCTVELWKGESDEEGKGGFGSWRVRASSSLYRGCRGGRQQPGEMVVVGGRRRRGRNQRRRSVLRSVQGEGRRGQSELQLLSNLEKERGKGKGARLRFGGGDWLCLRGGIHRGSEVQLGLHQTC